MTTNQKAILWYLHGFIFMQTQQKSRLLNSSNNVKQKSWDFVTIFFIFMPMNSQDLYAKFCCASSKNANFFLHPSSSGRILSWRQHTIWQFLSRFHFSHLRLLLIFSGNKEIWIDLISVVFVALFYQLRNVVQENDL